MTLHQATFRSYSTTPFCLWFESLARGISQVANPPLVGLVAVGLCARVVGTPSAWLWAGVYGSLAIVLPTFYIVWLLYRGQVSDLHLQVRQQRFRPLVVALIASSLSLILLQRGGAPRLLILLAMLNMVQFALFLGITRRWKISIHCAAAAGLTVLVWTLMGSVALLFALVVPLIAWARVYSSRHTFWQTMAGTALGSGLWATTLVLLGA